MPDDLLLIVDRVETGDPPATDTPPPAALAARDGRVTWLGPAADARRRLAADPPRLLIDRPDLIALPGLVDAHAHPAWVGEASETLALAADPAAIIEQIHRAAATPPADPLDRWIRGAGWHDDHWSHPPAAALAPLDALDRPVLLHRVDRHVAWANTAALTAAALTPTPDRLLVDAAIRPLTAALPPATPARRRRRLAAAVDRYAAAGLTALHDLCVTAPDVAAWQALAAADALPLRVALYLDADDPATAPLIAAGPDPHAHPALVGVKLFADGALGSRSAWLTAPYTDAPHTRGHPVVPPAQLTARALTHAAAGWSVAIHAIGDAAARAAVDAFTAVRRAGHRVPLRLEHAQIIDPPTLARLADLDLIAGVQPTHAAADAPFARARLGPERLGWAYRLASLAAAGATLVLGSDSPIAPIDPLGALTAATRGLDPIDFDAALAAATHAPARALGVDRGRLTPGRPADITLVAPDPRADPPTPARAHATLIDARVIDRGP